MHQPADAVQHGATPHPGPQSETPRLEVDALTVAFGGLTALDGVGFDVRPGETVALIGPNGAGKTTVFNAVCGVVRPSAGSIRIDGRPAPGRPDRLRSRGVARTLQGLGLYPHLSVLEHLLVPLGGAGGGADRDPRRGTGRRTVRPVDRALAALDGQGLADRASAPVASLSYPDRKRVALARALVTQPRLLLLDEPAGGLGEDDIERLAATVRSLAVDGCSVLLVEHHVDFVMGVADRVVVLDFGRVIASGLPDEVRRDPAVELAYLGRKAAS